MGEKKRARSITVWRKKRIEKNLRKDRSYKRLIYNRFIVTLSLVLLQIAGSLLLSFYFYNDGGRLALLIIDGIALITLLYIFNNYEKPSLKIGWMIMILFLPIFGVSLYIAFGRGRPTRKMHKKIAAAKAENIKAVSKNEEAEQRVLAMGRRTKICQYLSTYAGYPAYDDGTLDYFSSGKEMFAAMLEETEKAEKFILAEYFIIESGKMWDPFLELILKKANAGVQVRIIFDNVGSLFTLPPKYELYLESLHPNIKAINFNPVTPVFTTRMNNRDHRKFLIIDGKVAFTGGINLADEYIGEKLRFGYWKDTGLKITGKAVNCFTFMFFNIWNAFHEAKDALSDFLYYPEKSENDGGTAETNKKNEGFFMQPYDDSPLDRESVGETVYLDLIYGAKERLWIFTPYLILDDFLRTAITGAAKRGVDVCIVTPKIPDKKTVFRLTRANYAPLMQAGVKIYEYTPGFIHAKSMLSDDMAVVGTINLDYRSLYLHFEDAVYFAGCDAVSALKRDCEETFALSKLMEPSDVKRSFIGRLVDSVLRVFETLL